MATDLLSLLRLRGRAGGGALAQALGGRVALLRAVRAAGASIVTLGRARRTAYAARRPLRGSDVPLPLYRVDAQGQVHEIARLHPTFPASSCAVEFLAEPPWPLDDALRDGWFDGLPYPLYDMRPQGFLGRHFAQRHADALQLDANPERWSDDDVLHALSVFGEDTSGDLIVGETACRRWLERAARVPAGEVPEAIDAASREEAYAERAAAAMGSGIAGSSAGGEFPKFAALLRRRPRRLEHVLVKFSGSDASPGTQRWADLLACEALALATLTHELGIPAAEAELLHGGGRTYLETRRFDRHGPLGRSALVSWAALNGALFGLGGRRWGEVGRLLAARGWLPPDDVARLERLAHFGALIANTDMHDGNLSFVPEAGGLRLAPAYDMLPMLYAPQRGVELPAREYAPALPLPAEREAWHDAARAALVFWREAAAHPAIGKAFRAICRGNAQRLAALRP